MRWEQVPGLVNEGQEAGIALLPSHTHLPGRVAHWRLLGYVHDGVRDCSTALKMTAKCPTITSLREVIGRRARGTAERPGKTDLPTWLPALYPQLRTAQHANHSWVEGQRTSRLVRNCFSPWSVVTHDAHVGPSLRHLQPRRS